MMAGGGRPVASFGARGPLTFSSGAGPGRPEKESIVGWFKKATRVVAAFLVAVSKVVAAFLVMAWQVLKKLVVDLFTDFKGWIDEKRVWGNVLMFLGVYVVLANVKGLGEYTWITAGGLFGFGIAILGIAGSQDVRANGQKIDQAPRTLGPVFALLSSARATLASSVAEDQVAPAAVDPPAPTVASAAPAADASKGTP